MPASSSASRSGSPCACISSMKSNSTITWLTMTPIRLMMPRNAMKPNGAPHDDEADERAGDAERNGGEDDRAASSRS